MKKTAALFLFAVCAAAGCTVESGPYDVTPEAPLGYFKRLDRFLNADRRLQRESAPGLGVHAEVLKEPGRIYSYKIKEIDERTEDHADDRIFVVADEEGRVAGYAAYFRAVPRRSSRISRVTRRLWRILGGRQPEFRVPSAGEDNVRGGLPQAHFRHQGAHGIWIRLGGYDTIYFLKA